ncbi:MAG: hypothetical protein IJ164_04320 [Duodenibacillus sp.]|nr:hypothetical protein [Duodenibacillus sp.]
MKQQRDPYAPSSEDAVQTQTARARELVADVASSRNGREFLALVLDISQMNVSSFSPNALTMAFNEGRRSVGLSVASLIDHDTYQVMLKEAYERRKQQRN